MRKDFLARPWKTISITAVPLGILLLLLACAGAIYQFLGTRWDVRRFPQRGKSIQVDGVKLNLDCTGNRQHPETPTIILDSGLGVPAVGWIGVQPEVTKFARVCSYDRAGYGWSDLGPEPRTSLQIAKELKALLDAAGERGPHVMVGHSFGGFNVRVYTSLYPSDVVGVVLVEGSHEDEDRRMTELLPPAVIAREAKADLWNERMDRLLRPLRIRLGIQRLQLETGWGSADHGPLQRLSKELREELLYLRQQEKFEEAVAAESKAFGESVAEVHNAGGLGDRP